MKLTRQSNGNYLTDDGRFEVMRLSRSEYRLQDHNPGRLTPFGWSTHSVAFPRTLKSAKRKIRAAMHQVTAAEARRLRGWLASSREAAPPSSETHPPT